MKLLCSICARAGSKGVKNKNIRQIQGIPLIGFSLIRAQQSGLFDTYAVSSDSDEILAAARAIEPSVILIKRPAEMASDTAAKLPTIQHCFIETEKITGKKFDYLVDLDATSPLRTVEDISQAIELLKARPDADNLISVTPSRRTPYFSLLEDAPEGFIHLSKIPNPPIVRRQDAPNCYDINGSIYVWERSKLLEVKTVLTPKTLPYIMPAERSPDVDSEMDWRLVEMLITERIHEYR